MLPHAAIKMKTKEQGWKQASGEWLPEGANIVPYSDWFTGSMA
jgi:hypothetical protein